MLKGMLSVLLTGLLSDAVKATDCLSSLSLIIVHRKFSFIHLIHAQACSIRTSSASTMHGKIKMLPARSTLLWSPNLWPLAHSRLTFEDLKRLTPKFWNPGVAKFWGWDNFCVWWMTGFFAWLVSWIRDRPACRNYHYSWSRVCNFFTHASRPSSIEISNATTFSSRGLRAPSKSETWGWPPWRTKVLPKGQLLMCFGFERMCTFSQLLMFYLARMFWTVNASSFMNSTVHNAWFSLFTIASSEHPSSWHPRCTKNITTRASTYTPLGCACSRWRLPVRI